LAALNEAFPGVVLDHAWQTKDQLTVTAGGLLLALVIAIVKLVVGVLVIALFENSMARLRLDITPRITWAGFGFAFL
ncbi:hypothetical protein QQ73_07550, partial [Candidatus Endoriftia persephone str. Guaymas]|nr:hypothetical protein [Candidatus Endoriftia persephone str. Guaymas]